MRSGVEALLSKIYPLMTCTFTYVSVTYTYVYSILYISTHMYCHHGLVFVFIILHSKEMLDLLN